MCLILGGGMVTFAVTLKKGGVGKTTICCNLAQVLGVCNKKVLAIDNDEQHNLTKSLGLKTQKVDIADLYAGNMSVEEFITKGIYQTTVDGVDCIPASNKLAKVQVKGDNRLKELLERPEIQGHYDFALIDCPPGIKSKENEYAIRAANYYILPVEMKQFCIDGMVEMLAVLQGEFGVALQDILIIPNMIRDYIKKHVDIMESIRRTYPENVTDTYIPYDEMLDNVVTERKTLILNRGSAKATAYFVKLMFEVFGLNEDEVWETIIDKRKQERSEISKKNFIRARIQKTIAGKAEAKEKPTEIATVAE